MIKDRQPDWQDTNMSLFGSDIEKKCKAAAASGEPQWRGAGKIPGLQVWRIEQFRVKSWPKVKYGRFHEGDSYIILHTYQEDPANNPEKLAWDAYFWIGGKSTQDEYGTAAYKTVELDHYLNDAAVQYREVQESESSRFRALFNDKIMVLSGGVASGFKHVEAEVRESRLFTVKGRADNLVLKQVELRRDSMNSGDVFILDSEQGIFQWNGKKSNSHEKAKAAGFCSALRTERGGKVFVNLLAEGVSDGEDTEAGKIFWAAVPGERKVLGVSVGSFSVKKAEEGGADKEVVAFEPVLFEISDAFRCCGGVGFNKVGTGKLPISRLNTKSAYVLDTGFELFCWVGNGASPREKSSAMPFAQSYLKRYQRPPVLPITSLKEGREQTRFKAFFGPPEPEACVIM